MEYFVLLAIGVLFSTISVGVGAYLGTKNSAK